MSSIDQRALCWTALVPGDTRICPANIPAALAALLSSRLDHDGELWLGWKTGRRDLPALGRYRAVALLKPRGISCAWLERQGFAHIQSFAVVPRIDNPRWLIPLHSPQTALRAWELYTPHRRVAQIGKAMMRILARSRLLPQVSDLLILAQRERSELDTLLMRVLDTPGICTAIATGTPGPRRQLTLQVTSPAGTPLAYAKYADQPATAKVLRSEAGFLEYVQRLGLTSIDTPLLLYHGSLGNGYLMVSRPVGGVGTAGIELGERHQQALAELANQHGILNVGLVLATLRQRIERLYGRIDQAWYERLCGALNRAANGVATLPTALAHGDFAPWNVYVERHTATLGLLDWERGECEQLPLWDAFHFQTMVEILVRRRSAASILATVPAATLQIPFVQTLNLLAPQLDALYTGYLVGACVAWLEEHLQCLATSDRDQSVRGQMLDILVRQM